jgi:hypothetical protein
MYPVSYDTVSAAGLAVPARERLLRLHALTPSMCAHYQQYSVGWRQLAAHVQSCAAQRRAPQQKAAVLLQVDRQTSFKLKVSYP